MSPDDKNLFVQFLQFQYERRGRIYSRVIWSDLLRNLEYQVPKLEEERFGGFGLRLSIRSACWEKGVDASCDLRRGVM